MSALTVTNLCKSFGGLHVTTNVNLNVEPGERWIDLTNYLPETSLWNLL